MIGAKRDMSLYGDRQEYYLRQMILRDHTERSMYYDKTLPIPDDFGYNGYIVPAYEGHQAGNALKMAHIQMAMERHIPGLKP